MKIQAMKTDLQRAVGVVQNGVATRSTLPILANILVETNGGGAQLTATDLDIGICTKVSAEVLEGGGATIPAKRLVDIIKELPEGEVVLSVKKNNVFTIESQQCTFRIIGLAKDDFPQLPDFSEQAAVAVPQALLAQMLRLTTFAVSHDETRYILNGLLVQIQAGAMTLVATDGHRLAMVTRSIDGAADIEQAVVIPNKTVTELQRALGEEGDVAIRFEEKQVSFEAGGTHIISRLIDGEFPNFKQVVPQDPGNKLTVDRQAFLASIRRASVLTTVDSVAVRLEITQKKLVVAKETPDVGEIHDELEATYDGDDLNIAFNPKYLLDVVKNLEGEQVVLDLGGQERPAVIQEDGYVCIILPMQV